MSGMSHREFLKERLHLCRLDDIPLYKVLRSSTRYVDVGCWIACDKLSGIDRVAEGIAQDRKDELQRLIR